MTGQCWTIGAANGPESLVLGDQPIPMLQPGEALIAVRAAALNNRDLRIVSSRYHARRPADRIPLSDGCGTIAAFATGTATDLSIGDRVTAPHFVNWREGPFSPDHFSHDSGVSRNGWLAHWIVLPAASLIKLPDALSDGDAAAFPAAGATAWNGLHDFGGVATGEHVLLLGTGGVSIFGLQIALMAGAKPIIVSSRREKLLRAKALGAAVTICTADRPDWEAEVLAATGGAGADIVLETIGYATLQRSVNATAANGRIALIGMLGGDAVPGLDGLIARNITLKGLASGSRHMLAATIDAFVAQGLHPVVDAAFGFADAPAAYAALAAGRQLGKIVVKGPGADD